MSLSRLCLTALGALTLCLQPASASGQEVRASARFGRIAFDGAPAGSAGASSVVLGLGRYAPQDRLTASAAIPVGDGPAWAALAGWKRFQSHGKAGVLLDLSAHGFAQRQTQEGTAPAGPVPGPLGGSIPIQNELFGVGAGAELMVGLWAGTGTGRAELRAGGSAQRSQLGDAISERALPSADVRLSLGSLPVTLSTEVRGWFDDGATLAHGGATLQLAQGPFVLWGSAGTWMSGGVDGADWSAGGSVALNPLIELNAGGRGNSFDPLYRSTTATSWWAGMSIRLGAASIARAPVPARYVDGRATIRIDASQVTGVPSIAGDFTNWKPVPMQRQGSHWSWIGTLVPGVYNYAFVAEDGTWFVPESVPGRKDDGMGGHVAVLVVS
ncbi:MAG TPA: glycogen-binding domain-containing protein [Gemmatimonadales bacterium]|nr:glycogen-binding domain-containing protein [Gemmatimonadales bacterium]